MHKMSEIPEKVEVGPPTPADPILQSPALAQGQDSESLNLSGEEQGADPRQYGYQRGKALPRVKPSQLNLVQAE